MSKEQATVKVSETCVCGASVNVEGADSLTPFARAQLAEFRAAHEQCRWAARVRKLAGRSLFS